MKFGANLWIWESPITTEVIRTRAPFIRSLGFDVVEIPLETAESWDPATVRDILDDHGLAASVCVAMSPDRDLTTDDPSILSATQNYLLKAIEAAATVGATCIGGPIYSPTGRTMSISEDERQRLLNQLVENLQPVLDAAHDHGLRVAIEPLNRFETSLFNTVEQTLGLLHLLDHDAAALLLDTFHMNIEEADIAAAFRTAGPAIAHVHACGNNRGAPGNGSMPWFEIAKALTDIGYGGSLVIESFTADNEVMAAATSIWRPLAASQDQIATDGLRFLQGIFTTSE